MSAGDVRLSPERLARVVGAVSSTAGSPSLPEFDPVAAAAEPGSVGPRGGWVPEQPSPPRPGALGVVMGQGRHRDNGGLSQRVFSAPLGLRSVRVRPSGRAVAGLAIVVILALTIVGVRVWRADAAATPVPVGSAAATPSALTSRAMTGAAGPLGPGGATSSPSVTTASNAGAAWSTVHVVGAVRRPGVTRVPAGSRVQDAVQRCGGAVPGADLTGVNLARIVVDGEQIVVPTRGAPAPAGAGVSAPSRSAVSGASPPVPVNLNTADASALDELPGIGPKIAERIIAWRAAHGRFTTIDELGEVAGIGDAMLVRLRPLVTV
ncbi:MAG: ComEA family DNA-binding protein [Austwickia sp.]|nr:ComEA family DNA-binding protein [Austwickia sp.]